MSIDFSKAPEGATHYWPRDTGPGHLWYADRGDYLEVWNECQWARSHNRIGDRIHRLMKPIPTIGSKHDSGKPLMGAVPPNALLAVAKVLTFGAEKYGRDNWRQVESAETRYLDAALRHINAYQRGEAVDPESGESHLAHAVCSLMFMLELQEGE